MRIVKSIILLFLLTYANETWACGCGLEQSKRFKNKIPLILKEASETELIQAIRFTLYCDKVDWTESYAIAEKLYKGNKQLGSYFKYRFLKQGDKTKQKQALLSLNEAANLENLQAAFELAMYFETKNDYTKSFNWLLKASEGLHYDAVIKILNNPKYKSQLTKYQFQRLVVLEYYLKQISHPMQVRNSDEIDKLINNISIREYHQIMKSFFKKGNFQLLMHQNYDDTPSEPWNY